MLFARIVPPMGDFDKRLMPHSGLGVAAEVRVHIVDAACIYVIRVADASSVAPMGGLALLCVGAL
jgi:hypothetical protein